MIDPYQFVKILSNKLPEDAIVVCSNGTACVTYFQAGIVKKGQRIFWNSGCASMGAGINYAIGASFANPGKPIYCIEGDGSLMMSLSSLETVKHYNLPIKILVLSNNGYHSLQETYDNFCDGKHYGSDIGDLSFPDWYEVADTFEMDYWALNAEDKLNNTLDLILKYGGTQTLCEVFLGDYKFKKQQL